MDILHRIENQARSRVLVAHVRTQMRPGENWSQTFARMYPERRMTEVADAEFADRVGPSDRRAAIAFLLSELLRRNRREPENEAAARARLAKDPTPAGQLYRDLQDALVAGA